MIAAAIQVIAEHQSISQESIAMLRSVLPLHVIQRALFLLEQQQVSKFRTARAGRELFVVRGKQAYAILKEALYCPCSAFARALARHDAFLVRLTQCKHLLGIQIGEALGRVPVTELEDTEFLSAYLHPALLKY